MPDNAPVPLTINLRQRSRVLVLGYEEEGDIELSCELLRVYSPSAEVRGHGPGQEVLQTGKEKVNIRAVEPVGHYAVRLVFDDGHDSGIYSWDYLHDLARNRDAYWQRYLERLADAGIERSTG